MFSSSHCSSGVSGSISPPATSWVSEVFSRHMLSRMQSRPPLLMVASTSSMVLPGRSTRVCTSISPPAMKPRMSNENRTGIMSSRGWLRSISCTSSPEDAAMCCSRGLHAPCVYTVVRKLCAPVRM